jgi:repressor LexA
MKEPLTPKQQRVLDTIKKQWVLAKESPTVEELRSALNFQSLRTVVQYLDVLERKGYIIRRRTMKRNIELRDADERGMPSAYLVSVPVVANVGCDDLSVFAQEQYDEYLEVDKQIVDETEGGIVAVRAVGDSMNDAGIESGDYVLIRFTDTAENGDRVAAIIGDMITVKRFERKDGMVILHPESRDPKFKPIVLREDFKIVGKVLCVVSQPDATMSDVVHDRAEEDPQW